MSGNDNVVKTKNIKKYYVPKTMVIYFFESGLSVLDNLSKLVVEHTKFIQIGSSGVNRFEQHNELNKNWYDKEFYNWENNVKNKVSTQRPSSFFSEIGKKIVDELKKTDLVILVYKSNHVDSLEYVYELVSILHKNDIFAFHYVIENFIVSIDMEKKFKKLLSFFTKKRQIYVPIKEESVVLAYKNATIGNRSYFTNLYVNDLIDSFISPFLNPVENPDHFSRVKALFYQNEKNFESRVVSSMGYSDEKEDCIDVALIKAFANPMFCAAFDVSHTFIVNVKMPFITAEMFERINYVLKVVVGKWKTFMVSSYTGSYDYDFYCQISIMALNVEESKLITDATKIEQHIKNVLRELSDSKNLFTNNKTRELLLENKIELLEEKN